MLLLDRLQRVSSGECNRLIVMMPPGSAKSTYASILFPPWHFAAHAQDAVIAASHTAELAEKWGRRVRNIMVEDAITLGVGLAADSQAAGRWETDAGGEYFAAGVGGSITGRRADLAVIDDPVRSREDAESAIVREKIWDWYRADLYTRLKPGGRIVLIMTRWHEDDLAGRLIREMENGGDKWDILSLPAIAEENDQLGRAPGEPLWPEWEGAEDLERRRRTVGPRDWSALYQQRPAPETGDYFSADWIRVSDIIPDKSTLMVYGGSDYAVTADGGDYTVHAIVGVDHDGRMYLLDLWRKRASSDQWVEAFCDLVLAWRPIGWAEETGQIKSGVGPFLDRRMRERRAFVAREQFPTRGDKAVRAQSIRGRMALNGLYVSANAPWLADFRAELLSFPSGKHDDQVDALGLVGQLLDKMVHGIAPKIDKPKPTDGGYRDAYSARDEDNHILVA